MKRLLCAYLCGVAVFFGWSAALAMEPERPPIVLIVGDSLSAAYRISPSRSWPSLLQSRLDNLGIKYVVINASRTGETTRDGVKRINALLATHHPRVVVLELGANDGLRRYPLSTVLGNLNRLAEAICQAGAMPVIVGMRLPPGYPPEYSAGFENLFNDVAQHASAAYVPFLLDHVAGHAEYVLSDGLHPNAKGQDLLLENVWGSLAPLLLPKTEALP